MLLFTSLIVIAFSVLQIILFFKLWGMANDVRRIKEMMQENWGIEKKLLNQIHDLAHLKTKVIKVGDLVVRLKDEKQMRVMGMSPDGGFECSLLGNPSSEVYKREDIELYNVFYGK